MNTALVGCTGLVGSQILYCLQNGKHTVHAIARKEISSLPPSTKLVHQPDSAQWPDDVKALAPVPDVFLSALGSTRAQAGSLAAQRAIDLDLNLALARAAKESGVKTYVLISSGAASTKSIFPYFKMKGELEDAVKLLDFPHTVIVKPGILVGSRQDSRPAENVVRTIASALGKINKIWLTDWWAQDADLVGRAAVAAALECSEGKREKGVWFIQQHDIVRLGRQAP